jgi:dTDP-4-amino-4,6-dideoxygalactose transaminase
MAQPSSATASSSACSRWASAAACTTSRCTCTPTGERYGLRPEQFAHSQKAYERMLSLPLYTRMTDGDVQRVITAVTQALAGPVQAAARR